MAKTQHETQIFKTNSLRDKLRHKLHNVTAFVDSQRIVDLYIMVLQAEIVTIFEPCKMVKIYIKKLLIAAFCH